MGASASANQVAEWKVDDIHDRIIGIDAAFDTYAEAAQEAGVDGGTLLLLDSDDIDLLGVEDADHKATLLAALTKLTSQQEKQDAVARLTEEQKRGICIAERKDPPHLPLPKKITHHVYFAHAGIECENDRPASIGAAWSELDAARRIEVGLRLQGLLVNFQPKHGIHGDRQIRKCACVVIIITSRLVSLLTQYEAASAKDEDLEAPQDLQEFLEASSNTRDENGKAKKDKNLLVMSVGSRANETEMQWPTILVDTMANAGLVVRVTDDPIKGAASSINRGSRIKKFGEPISEAAADMAEYITSMVLL